MTAKRFLNDDDKNELQTGIEAAGKVASDASRVAQDAATTAHDTAKRIINPNLLYNAYFGNPVNRNGKTEYTGANIVTIDGWINTGIGTIYVTDGGVISSKNTYLMQRNPSKLPKEYFLGKTVTFSVLTNDGLKSATKVLPQEFPVQYTEYITFWHASGKTTTFNYSASTSSWGVDVIRNVSDGDSPTIIAVKLELGDQQTLAHQENGVWVLNEIPDYAEQMAICQQYNPSTGEYIGQMLPIDGSVPMSGNSLWLKDGYGRVDVDTQRMQLASYTVQKDGNNRRALEISNAVGRPLLINALRLHDIVDNTQTIYNIYGEHNITCGTSDITAGTSALTTGCYYDVYK